MLSKYLPPEIKYKNKTIPRFKAILFNEKHIHALIDDDDKDAFMIVNKGLRKHTKPVFIGFFVCIILIVVFTAYLIYSTWNITSKYS